MNNPTKHQTSRDHYTKLAIQPMQYSMTNGLNPLQANIIKYATCYKDKGGIEDLRKAAHCVELLIQHEMDEAQKRSGLKPQVIAINGRPLKDALHGYEMYSEVDEKRMDVVWHINHGVAPDLVPGTRVIIECSNGFSTHGEVSGFNWELEGNYGGHSIIRWCLV